MDKQVQGKRRRGGVRDPGEIATPLSLTSQHQKPSVNGPQQKPATTLQGHFPLQSSQAHTGHLPSGGNFPPYQQIPQPVNYAASQPFLSCTPQIPTTFQSAVPSHTLHTASHGTLPPAALGLGDLDAARNSPLTSQDSTIDYSQGPNMIMRSEHQIAANTWGLQPHRTSAMVPEAHSMKATGQVVSNSISAESNPVPLTTISHPSKSSSHISKPLVAISSAPLAPFDLRTQVGMVAHNTGPGLATMNSDVSHNVDGIESPHKSLGKPMVSNPLIQQDGHSSQFYPEPSNFGCSPQTSINSVSPWPRPPPENFGTIVRQPPTYCQPAASHLPPRPLQASYPPASTSTTPASSGVKYLGDIPSSLLGAPGPPRGFTPISPGYVDHTMVGGVPMVAAAAAPHIHHPPGNAPLSVQQPPPISGTVMSAPLPNPAYQSQQDSATYLSGPVSTQPTPLKSAAIRQGPSTPHGYPPTRSGFHNVASRSTQPSFDSNQLASSMMGLGMQQEKFQPVDLLQERNILPMTQLPPLKPNLHPELQKRNCRPDIFCCTLTNVPQTQALLHKARLPLGLLLHPFKDVKHLPVIASSTIVRCRLCRTYINPFITFLQSQKWKCNLCYQINDVPDDFVFNPVTHVYGNPLDRPEIQYSTIEFIAPAEYMVRPPQPAVYLFLFDVSFHAVATGYLSVVCQNIIENLNSLPGDSRTRVGIMTYDGSLHFYNLQEGLTRPQMLVVTDTEDVFVPCPEGLLPNFQESKELLKELLMSLPTIFSASNERGTDSALGPALQAALKMLSPTGGRITVFQTQLPSRGPGTLKARTAGTSGDSLGPATDFYKKLALDCSGQQVAVDLFLLSGQHADLATLSGVCQFSSGSVHYYPALHVEHAPAGLQKLKADLQRYLTRKIGFEAIMKIRCSKGLSIHTFHGNFFVRSTDLLSLPNISPDAGFAVQLSIEDNLSDFPTVAFQTALLYTSSKGERRIRVHTLCLPVVTTVQDVHAGADSQAITCLLAKMAVDRTVSSSLSDARDALVNAAIDFLSASRTAGIGSGQSALFASYSLRLLPLYILALLKQPAIASGSAQASLDSRVFAMCEIKLQPVAFLMPMIHPNLYRVDTFEGSLGEDGNLTSQPSILKLSAEKMSGDGVFLLDCGSVLYLWLGRNCKTEFLSNIFGVSNVSAIQPNTSSLPELQNPESERLRAFLGSLRKDRPLYPLLHVIREIGPERVAFIRRLVEDRTESAMSYYEFLLHLQQQVCK
uniref:protein transport protein Sec24A-like isoform X2 n=1 Tax=Myxine glutinosa TaxID=7769 RepID=UPI00358F882D